MDSQSRSTRFVLNISSCFGVNFTVGSSHFGVFYLQLFFAFVTVFCLYAVMESVRIPVYIFVLIVQIVCPLIFGICMNFEAYRKRKLENKIVENLKKLNKALKTNFATHEVISDENCSVKFLTKFSILIVVRIVKICYAGTLISMSMMFPEFVGAANDYAFAFYVDILKVRMQNYSTVMKSENFDVPEARKYFMAFHKLSHMLIKRFQISLFLNITLNFIVLIINMYWIFIRIVYGPFRWNIKTRCFQEHLKYFLNIFSTVSQRFSTQSSSFWTFIQYLWLVPNVLTRWNCKSNLNFINIHAFVSHSIKFDKLASVLVKKSEQQKSSIQFLPSKHMELRKLENLLILLKSLKVKFQVMGMINIEKTVIVDVSNYKFKRLQKSINLSSDYFDYQWIFCHHDSTFQRGLAQLIFFYFYMTEK